MDNGVSQLFKSGTPFLFCGAKGRQGYQGYVSALGFTNGSGFFQHNLLCLCQAQACRGIGQPFCFIWGKGMDWFPFIGIFHDGQKPGQNRINRFIGYLRGFDYDNLMQRPEPGRALKNESGFVIGGIGCFNRAGAAVQYAFTERVFI
jgi:hypothetical protein